MLLPGSMDCVHGNDGPIQSVTHHSVSARTIRHRLQLSGMSARCPLLRLTLTGNNRCLRYQWCDGVHGQRNGTKLCLLANPAAACNITMVGFEFGDTVVRGC
ncbi:hypothetical protein TNCV_2706101 [Trichonephila clavipes]|nr:hypothetical protein TNCV_2706101 [Trichonephila clavipes]